MKQVAQVKILGQLYTFRGDVDPNAIEQVAQFVSDRIDEVIASGQTADTLNAVVLTLMNVAGEYLELRDGHEAVHMQQRLEKLLGRLEDALQS